MASLWERLPREVSIRGGMTRFFRYQTPSPCGRSAEFFGIEVEEIGHIPADLVAWELTPRQWTVWKGGSGGPVITWREEIQWLWLEHATPNTWHLGEFTARGPAAMNPDDDSRPLLLTGHAPVLPGKAPPDEVRLVAYDPAWPARFQEFAEWLGRTLGPETALRIEHFGSTAIPGMPAKPIIDILVEIPSFEAAKPRVLPRLLDPEWEYWWYAEKITLIRRDGPLGQRTHHIHLAPKGHAVWAGIGFRDYLRQNPADAHRYAELKHQLAAAHHDDREAYTQAKSEFVQRINALTSPRRV